MSATLGMTRAYTAGAAIRANRLVKFSADYTVVEATASSDLIIGVSDNVAVSSGDRVDVFKDGVVPVVLGGAVTRGQPVTSDANGAGVQGAPGAGINIRVIGFAETSGVAGDIIDVTMSLGFMQG
jgi:hypothetical protein